MAIVNVLNMFYYSNMKKFFVPVAIFVLLFSFFASSSKAYAAVGDETSVFQAVIDIFRKILDASNTPQATQSANQQYGGGSAGGAGSSRGWGPLPNMTGEIVEQNKILADQMLNNPNINLNCYEDRCHYYSSNVVSALKNGQAPVICTNGCGSCSPGGPSGQTTMNPKVLQGLLEVSKSNSICVTALSNAVHSSGSSHYYGNAADIDVSNLSPQQQQQIRAQLNGFCSSGGAICEVGSDDDPTCTQNNHIHWTCKDR